MFVQSIRATNLALWGLFLVLFTSASAFAAPVSLVCNNESRPGDPLLTIDLDEAKGTATINLSAFNTPSNPPIHVPAKSVGPLAAKFNPKAIAFSYTETDGGTTSFIDYRIDRLTGVLLFFVSFGAKFEQVDTRMRSMSRYTCQVGKAKF